MTNEDIWFVYKCAVPFEFGCTSVRPKKETDIIFIGKKSDCDKWIEDHKLPSEWEAEKRFHCWLAGPGEASSLDNKTKTAYLDSLKSLYLETLKELNSVGIELVKEKEFTKLKDERIQQLKDLNSELTKENMELESRLYDY